MMAKRQNAARFPIAAVAKLTDISVDTLRAWERRYEAVTPTRDERGRVYSDADVARLRLLRDAVAAGHSVGRVARLSDAALRKLSSVPAAAPAAMTRPDTAALSRALEAIDPNAVEREVARLAAQLSPLALVRDALLPALREAGDDWHRRSGGIAREHLMSATLRNLLGSFLRQHRYTTGTRLLLTTPPGDQHEIGILSAAMLAAAHGFPVTYLGPNLPAAETVTAARAAQAQVVILGITFSGNHAQRRRDLLAIAKGLGQATALWLGGRDAEQYRDLEPRVSVMSDLDGFIAGLSRLRSE